jgi:hypothetical protein
MTWISDEEYMKIMEDADNAMTQWCLDQQAKNEPLLAMVKELVGLEVFAQVEDEIVSAENTYDYEIVNEPAGHPQDNGFALGDVYVDQSCGMSGDDFSGTVALPLPDGRYFQFSFNC